MFAFGGRSRSSFSPFQKKHIEWTCCIHHEKRQLQIFPDFYLPIVAEYQNVLLSTAIIICKIQNLCFAVGLWLVVAKKKRMRCDSFLGGFHFRMAETRERIFEVICFDF